MALRTDSATVTTRLEALTSDPGYAQLTAEYFSPELTFAGATFLDLAPNPPAEFCSADLVAASLLDVRFSPRAVRALLANGQDLVAVGSSAEHRDAHLIARDLPDDRDLWEATEAELEQLAGCYTRLVALPSVGRVKATKLLARKRPALVPVFDRVVDEVLGLEPNQFRDSIRAMRDALRNPTLRAGVDCLRPAHSTLPLIRILDAAVWMAGSRSGSAGEARLRVGLAEEPPMWTDSLLSDGPVH